MSAEACDRFSASTLRFHARLAELCAKEWPDWLSAHDAAAFASAIGAPRLSARTLLMLARNGKIDFTFGPYNGWPRNGGRKLWFHTASLRRLVEAHMFTWHSGDFAFVSQTLSSRKVAASKYFPGEVITKAEVSVILNLSVRGIEDLMDRGHLKPIRLGHRLVIFGRKKVYALERLRRPKSWRRGPRLPDRRIDSGKQWEAA
jgi:hypothetical protein